MEKLFKLKFKPKKDHFVVPKKANRQFPIEKVYKNGVILSDGVYSITKVVRSSGLEFIKKKKLNSCLHLQIDFVNKSIHNTNESVIFIVLSISKNVKNAEEILLSEIKKVTDGLEILDMNGIDIIHNFYNPSGIKNINSSELFDKSVSLKDFLSNSVNFEKDFFSVSSHITRCYYFREFRYDLIENLSKLYFTIKAIAHIDKSEGSSKFKTGIYLYTTADSIKELEKRDNILINICKRYKSNIEIITYQPENALCSLLPLGIDKINIKSIDKANLTGLFSN